MRHLDKDAVVGFGDVFGDRSSELAEGEDDRFAICRPGTRGEDGCERWQGARLRFLDEFILDGVEFIALPRGGFAVYER